MHGPDYPEQHVSDSTYVHEQKMWVGWCSDSYHRFCDVETAFAMVVTPGETAFVCDMRYPHLRLTVRALDEMITRTQQRLAAMQAARAWLASHRQPRKPRRKPPASP